MDKHSSLLWKVVTYNRKKFYNIGHRQMPTYDTQTIGKNNAAILLSVMPTCCIMES